MVFFSLSMYNQGLNLQTFLKETIRQAPGRRLKYSQHIFFFFYRHYSLS